MTNLQVSIRSNGGTGSPAAARTARPAAFPSGVDLVDTAVALVTATLLVVVGLGVTGVGRVALALVFVTFVPGWAVLDHVPLADGASRVALAVALSLSLSILAAASVLWLHLWDPRVLLYIAGTICLVAVVWHLAHPGGPPPRVRIRPASGARRTGLRLHDLLLPAAIVLWWAGVDAAQPAAVNDYGLLPALPVVFFVALGLLVCSIVAVLLRAELSPLRLGLHLVAFVAVLHGTIPLIFSEPIYPWVYKHVGVVGYIDLHGSVDAGVDIYHNWPGFFALGAWFTGIAGVASPLDYAAWAPVYVNLLICLELGFVFRSLPVTQRTRWLGLFVFVAGNWVGQDYFAPQAVAFILSLAVFGMALAWLQTDRPVAVVRVARRMASRLGRPRRESSDAEGAPPSPRPPRLAALSALFLVFAAVVVTHQLSPYVVVLGLGVLATAGLVRPRWVVVGLAAMAIAYLLLRLPYVERTQDLFSSLGDPFGNIHNSRSDGSVVMTGHRLTALAAPALIACLWTLGMLGILRRLRAGRPILVLALLAFSPTVIALGQSYGGEAVFRIYLFSLPWIALLAASALEFRSRRRRLWPAITVGVVLFSAVAMFMSAFFGSAELYVVRPGEVQASQYFYDHAEPGGVLALVAPNFPTRVGGRYNEFSSGGDNPPDLLTTGADVRHRMLGAGDLPAIAQFAEQHGGSRGGHYLVLSTGQQVYAEVLGLLPPGSLAGLDGALARSRDWRVFYRNRDAVIYRFAPEAADEPAADRPSEPDVGRLPPGRPRDRSVDVAGLWAGLVGLGVIALVLLRRTMAAHLTKVVPEEELLAPKRIVSGAERRGVEEAEKLRQDARRVLEEASVDAAGRRAEAERVLAEAERVLAESRVEAERILAEADVRVAAIGALARTSEPDQLGALALALADPDPAVRASALETFPVAGTRRAAAQVLAAAEDRHEAVRAAAYRRLAAAPSWVLWMALGRCSRRPELLAVLEDEAGADRLAALVRERVSSPDVADRVLALELSGHLGTPALLAEAVNALSDPEAAVRRQAARALADLGADDALLAFLGALQDPDVRRRAAELLRKGDTPQGP